MPWAGHNPGRIFWDDLTVPATGIRPGGGTFEPDIDVTLGGTLLYDGGRTEVAGLVCQFSHAWAEGTDIEPHVHWAKTTSASGNVLWRMEYRWSSIGEVMDSSWTTLDVTTTVSGTPDTDTAEKHLISEFGTIDCTGKSISDMMIIQISRIGGDASDTYAADARLLEFDIHFQRDFPGSFQEFIKDPAE